MARKTQQKKRNALGRGLSALLDDNEHVNPLTGLDDKSEGSVQPKGDANFQNIKIDQIEVNPFQPRIDFDEEALEELAISIKVHGVIQPITVRKLSDKEFQLISGERRLQASRRINLEHIPAYIKTADDQQMLEMGLIENIQRDDLNAIEVALSYQRLMVEIGLKLEELGGRVGKKRASVNNYLRLLKLPPVIQAGVREKKISFGHARTLINIDDADLQLALFHQIINEGLSVRKVEDLVRAINMKDDTPEKVEQPEPVNADLLNLQTHLSSHFGTKIKVKSDTKNKGNISIPFVSLEDLNRILEILDVDL